MMQTIEGKRAIQNRILKWFDTKTRNLPWLITKSPYHVWVSEIMLQQTQISTVVRYFERFVKKFPTIRKLAASDEESVLKMWEGLGYYRRAKQLHSAANVIVNQHNAEFPTEIDEVLSLPGIGKYTAAAILSISMEQPYAILEGNTIRLFARLMCLAEDTKSGKTQKKLWRFSENLIYRQRPGDFNQAVMDLGREICKPKKPLCDRCPISDYCPTYVRGLQGKIPHKGSKMQYEELHEAIVLIERGGKILLRKCQPGERWAGLWDFPRASMDGKSNQIRIAEAIQAETGLQTQVADLETTIKHGVTKYRIRLDCFRATKVAGSLKRGSNFKWQTKKQIENLPFSSTGRKFADQFV